MLARQHANLGVIGMIASSSGVAAIGIAELPFIPIEVSSDMAAIANPAVMLVTTLIGAAFALVPDLDHPGSTVSRKFGMLSQMVSRVFGKLTGGHREASHSMLFAMLCGILGMLIVLIRFEITVAGVTITSTELIIGIILVLSVSLIARLILPGHGNYMPIMGGSILLAAAIITPAMSGIELPISAHVELPWFILPFAMFMGVVLHALGDACTPSGVKFLYPSQRVLRLHINGRTGQDRELFIIQPILALGAAVLIWFAIVSPFIHIVGATA